ncbi:MAG: AraC family transcriptional regulator [Lachnospiraceae bacterium]|nr:AraC family transcriptional regulator [Lachnospiraceae bacterium]
MHAFFEKRETHFHAFRSPGLTFPLHLHPQLELYLCLSGQAVVTVRSQTKTLTAGHMAIIFPNEIHSYTALTPDTTDALIICDLSYTGGYTDPLLSNHPQDPFLTPKQIHPNVLYAIDEIIAEYQSREKSTVFAPLIQLTLARLLPTLTLSRNKSTDHQELTYQIAQYISEHFREPLTLGILAQKLGLSKYHLSHLFSEKIGQSFLSYLSGIRLSYACSRLSETDLPITEIAEDAGFESQSTFFRVFKNQLGVTPLKYRQNAQLQQNRSDSALL